ncbi:MAG: hypothetical protein MUF26_05155, partial [Syntrophales bacterium]|nr:hypothetical protein [Syntrophales bacterium]
SGMATAHVNVTFQKVLPQYRSLNAIIVMTGGNDVWGWLEVGAPSAYRPSPVPITDTCFVCPGRRFSWSPRSSALNLVRREAMIRWLKPIHVRQNTGRWLGRARLMRAHAREIRNSVGDLQEMLAYFESNFRELLGNAKRYSRRVVVALQPWFEKEHYTPEELAHLWSGGMGNPHRGDNVTVYYSLEVCSQLLNLVNERAVKIADELGVAHLDLMPVLEPSLENYYDFIHFTPAGAGLVAEAIARFLLRSERSQQEAAWRDATATRPLNQDPGAGLRPGQLEEEDGSYEKMPGHLCDGLHLPAFRQPPSGGRDQILWG